MAAASEKVCPPPQTRTSISISQSRISLERENTPSVPKDVVVHMKTERKSFHSSLGTERAGLPETLTIVMFVTCQ